MKIIRFLLSTCVLLAMALIFSCSTTIEGGDESGNKGNNNSSVIPKIKIVNNTGYSIYYIYIKPSISTDWGSDIYAFLPNGESQDFSLSHPLSTHSEYDIKLQQYGSDGHIFTKYKFTVSNGMTVTFTAADLTYESDFPNITIQNRTGAGFNSIYVKPSSAPDWGKNFGSLSNNYDKLISIPIPPSSYTEFDIQVRSTNPTAIYTKKNVTITNGATLTYTRADSDVPLIGSPIIVIQNNTGYSISYVYIKASSSADWGAGNYAYLSDGESQTYELPQPLSVNALYDIRLGTSSDISGGYQFIKYDVSVSDGIIVTLIGSDLQ